MTKIEWVQNSDGSQGRTWNPITGCSKVSEGCRFCFAERMAHRLAGRYGYPEYPHHFDVTLHPDKLDVPLRRKKPTTYFVCSMSDLFHEDVPDEFILRVFDTIAVTPQHTYQILTKRPRRMLDFLMWWQIAQHHNTGSPLPLKNAWLGISCENQATADERIPILLQIPAAVHYVSLEPLLEAIDLRGWMWDGVDRRDHPKYGRYEYPTGALSWTIIGGESGPDARPMMINWAEDIVGQCQAADVPVFMKQVGTWAAKQGRYKSHKGNDPAEWPRALRVREMPA